MKNTVTLATGEAVPSDSPAWLDECAARRRHVVTMRGLKGIPQQEAYFANVLRSEGDEAEARLRAAVVRDWDERQADWLDT